MRFLRNDLVVPAIFFESSRRVFDPKVGRVAMRFFGRAGTAVIIAAVAASVVALGVLAL